MSKKRLLISFASLRSRMLTWFMIPVLLICMAGGVLLFIQFQHYAVQTIDEEAARLTRARAAELGQWLQGRLDEIRAFSVGGELWRLENVGDQLRRYRDQRIDTYESMFLARANGDVVARSDGSPDGINLSYRQYHTELFSHGKSFAVGNPVSSTATGHLIMVIVQAVFDPQGDKVGMFGGTVQLTVLNDIVTQIRLSEDGYGWIIDGAGMAISHPDETIRMKLNILEADKHGFVGVSDAGRSMLAGEFGVARKVRGRKGEDLVLFFAPIPNSPGWALGITVSAKDLYRKIYALSRSIVLMTILLLLAVFLISLVSGAMISRPLKKLTNAVSTFGQETPVHPTNGEARKKPIIIAGRDEIASLAQTFNKMAESVDNTIASLRLTQFSLDKAPESIIWIGEQERITYVNDATCSYTGYTREELMTMKISDIDPDYFGADIQEATVQLRARGTVHFETRHKRKDGTVFPVDTTCSRIAFSGQELTCAFIRDITDRKTAETDRERLQLQLVQAQKMESVGRLAGGVAHDFNNMLGVILGRSEMAIRKLEEGNTEVHSDVEGIRRAAERSAEMVHQLLAYARKQAINPQVINLNEVVSETLSMLHRLIGENVELIWRPGTAPWLVKMDKSQVERILVNLCVNARDALSGNGHIIIETENFTCDLSYCSGHTDCVPGEYLRLTISDNGCGMDKETRDHLFEPFFTTKETGKGTGLGLASIYGAVRQNSGFITVYSEPNVGTTLSIHLPRHLSELEFPVENDPISQYERGHETILLVEDESEILEVTRMMLESFGYTVISTTSPKEATRLGKLYVESIDLLISDVIMPEMNGRELAEKIRSLNPGIKTLFMSGYTADIISHHGVLEEGVQFIHKPFSMKVFSEKIRTAIGQK